MEDLQDYTTEESKSLLPATKSPVGRMDLMSASLVPDVDSFHTGPVQMPTAARACV